MTSIRYQVGGALLQDVSSYVTRDSDRQLFEALKAGEFCYVLNSRQMGKSSLMVRTLAQLQDSDWKGIILDFSAKGTQSDQPDSWYFGIINELNKGFHLLESKDCIKWFKERDIISPVERLGEFIETVLLPGIMEPIVIFVDEIDSTLGLPFTDDFFALIRACYNRRAEKSDYKRLTFALLGVAAPSELIGDTKRTPFNIGKSIDLSGFTLVEAQPLAAGLAEKSENPQAVLEAILYWTGGQPFLSQRLCQLVADVNDYITAGSEASFVEVLVRSRLIEHWESQDQQSHLKTIRDRVIKNEQKAGYLLELYRQTRQAGSLPVQNRPEEQELQLSGVVVKREGNLQVYNPIYAEVFNELWIDGELAKLRPYAETFRAWVISEKTDKSRLLRGDALKEAEQWAKEKNPSTEDQDFLSASRIQEREEEFAVKEKEAELERERQDKKAAENARKIEAEAKEIAEKGLVKAGTKIRVGTLVLVVTLALSGVSVVATGIAVKEAQNAQQELQVTQMKAHEAAMEAQREVQVTQMKAAKAKKQAQQAQQVSQIEQKKATQATENTKRAEIQVKNIQKDLKSKQAEASRAEKAVKDAKQKAKNAKELALKAQGDLTKTQVEKEKLSKEAIRLQEEANRLEVVAKQAEENATRAKIELEQANQLKEKAVQSVLETKVSLSKINEALSKTNEALKEIKSLSKLAAELRKKGEIEASNELSTRVTSSVLIEDYELKRIWLLAAKAQANQSLGNLDKQELQKFNQSLESLKNISSKNDPGIFNQVKAFAYLIAGQLNNNQKEDYQMAYNALQESKLNLYDDKTDADLLTEKDVDNIHYQLIKANRVDINSSNEVAINFRNHLYKGLEFLLKNDRLKEADMRTSEIVLYIAGRYENLILDDESLTNFSCDALKEIDKHWYYDPRLSKVYGFRVQKEIWENNGRPTDNSSDRDWRKFGIALGWKTEESGTEDDNGWVGWGKYDQLFSEDGEKFRGQLPTFFYGGIGIRGEVFGKRWIGRGGLFSRCKLEPLAYKSFRPSVTRILTIHINKT